jgi:hypothetical protein
MYSVVDGIDLVCRRPKSALEPRPNAENEAEASYALALGSGKPRAVTQLPVVGNPDIRRELPSDLVAQAEPQLDIA